MDTHGGLGLEEGGMTSTLSRGGGASISLVVLVIGRSFRKVSLVDAVDSGGGLLLPLLHAFGRGRVLGSGGGVGLLPTEHFGGRYSLSD